VYEKARQLEALLRTYKSAVINAAQDAGLGNVSFGDALLVLPPETVRSLRESFKKQVEAIEKQHNEES
jgi:hypothetical protein